MNCWSRRHRSCALDAAGAVRQFVVSVGLGLLAGVPSGLASFAFLEVLDRAIRLRELHAVWLIWLLPIAAFAISTAYHHAGGAAGRGTTLVMEETDRTSIEGVPRRMAPMIFAAAVLAHMFGASVGREGVALQMAASLADGNARRLGLNLERRRAVMHAALAGGFGSVFGVPFAAVVFAFEVRRRWRPSADVVVSAITASFTGDWLVKALGHHHPVYPALGVGLSMALAVKVGVAGLAFGATAALFIVASRGVRRALRGISHPPVRAAIAGLVVAIGAAIFGRQYLSLSTPLAATALAGVRPAPFAWFGKLGFTAVSFGGGIPGGEVTPLFVTGAVLGAALAHPMGVPVALLAGMGFVAVFAGASKTPMTCAIVFAELFGWHDLPLAALACGAAFIAAGPLGLYPKPLPAIASDHS